MSQDSGDRCPSGPTLDEFRHDLHGPGASGSASPEPPEKKIGRLPSNRLHLLGHARKPNVAADFHVVVPDKRYVLRNVQPSFLKHLPGSDRLHVAGGKNGGNPARLSDRRAFQERAGGFLPGLLAKTVVLIGLSAGDPRLTRSRAPRWGHRGR